MHARRVPATLAVFLFLISILSLSAAEAKGKGGGGRVHVRGYTRKDGTYVQPHTRTAPDGNPRNNYSFPGNYNPNTGKITPGDPDKYLERYYDRGSSTPAMPPSSYVAPEPPGASRPPSVGPPSPTGPEMAPPRLGGTQGPYRIRLKDGKEIMVDTYRVRGTVLWGETANESIGLAPSDVVSITPLLPPR